MNHPVHSLETHTASCVSKTNNQTIRQTIPPSSSPSSRKNYNQSQSQSYVPAHTCPNDAYSVLGSTLARVLTPAPLLVAEERETDAERERWWFPLVVTGAGRYVAAIGTRIVVIIIPQSDSMCEARPRRVLRFASRPCVGFTFYFPVLVLVSCRLV